MHELGIVFYIIRDVKEAAEKNGVAKISSVTMQLGEVTTVIPYYLEDCWKWAVKKEGKLLQDAELVIEKIPAVTFCEDCEKEYPTVENGKTCPYCKSEKTFLRRGNEVMIKEITACEYIEGENPASDSKNSEDAPDKRNADETSIESGMQAEEQ